MSDEQRNFLQALAEHGPTFRKGLPDSNRAQDRARQHAKKHGLAKYGREGWRITAAGRRALGLCE